MHIHIIVSLIVSLCSPANAVVIHLVKGIKKNVMAMSLKNEVRDDKSCDLLKLASLFLSRVKRCRGKPAHVS